MQSTCRCFFRPNLLQVSSKPIRRSTYYQKKFRSYLIISIIHYSNLRAFFLDETTLSLFPTYVTHTWCKLNIDSTGLLSLTRRGLRPPLCSGRRRTGSLLLPFTLSLSLSLLVSHISVPALKWIRSIWPCCKWMRVQGEKKNLADTYRSFFDARGRERDWEGN